MTYRPVGPLLHLTGALAFVAGIVVAGVAFESARGREAPAEIALLLGQASCAPCSTTAPHASPTTPRPPSSSRSWR